MSTDCSNAPNCLIAAIDYLEASAGGVDTSTAAVLNDSREGIHDVTDGMVELIYHCSVAGCILNFVIGPWSVKESGESGQGN